MKTLILLALAGAAVALASCRHARDAGELRLKHQVTLETPNGLQTFHSVVSLIGTQSYNYHTGGSGWGGISSRLTGEALRVPVGDHDFYFLLARPGGSTPAWTQAELIKDYFGLPNATDDAAWVDQWKRIAAMRIAVPVGRNEWPAIAVVPRDGFTDDARIVTPDEAEALGLQIATYTLQPTADPVGTTVPVVLRYRPQSERKRGSRVGREMLSVTDGTA